jgi:energy-coupling factor transport system permease protein
VRAARTLRGRDGRGLRETARLTVPVLLLGAVLAGASLLVGASRDGRSGHRRERWAWTETVTVAAGAVPAAVLVVASVQGWDGVVPSQRAELPALPLLAVVAVLVAAIPAWVTPHPREAAP